MSINRQERQYTFIGLKFMDCFLPGRRLPTQRSYGPMSRVVSLYLFMTGMAKNNVKRKDSIKYQQNAHIFIAALPRVFKSQI
jgi:hypothetical protein